MKGITADAHVNRILIKDLMDTSLFVYSDDISAMRKQVDDIPDDKTGEYLNLVRSLYARTFALKKDNMAVLQGVLCNPVEPEPVEECKEPGWEDSSCVNSLWMEVGLIVAIFVCAEDDMLCYRICFSDNIFDYRFARVPDHPMRERSARGIIGKKVVVLRNVIHDEHKEVDILYLRRNNLYEPIVVDTDINVESKVDFGTSPAVEPGPITQAEKKAILDLLTVDFRTKRICAKNERMRYMMCGGNPITCDRHGATVE